MNGYPIPSNVQRPKMNMASPHDMHAAVQAAKNTLYSWSQNTTPEQRIADFRQLLLIYEVYLHDLGTLISTEMCSPLQAAIPESCRWWITEYPINTRDVGTGF